MLDCLFLSLKALAKRVPGHGEGEDSEEEDRKAASFGEEEHQEEVEAFEDGMMFPLNLVPCFVFVLMLVRSLVFFSMIYLEELYVFLLVSLYM